MATESLKRVTGGRRGEEMSSAKEQKEDKTEEY